MATHSSVLAWRIRGTGELGRLPSVGWHRVGHNWSDLAAAAAVLLKLKKKNPLLKTLRGHLDLFWTSPGEEIRTPEQAPLPSSWAPCFLRIWPQPGVKRGLDSPQKEKVLPSAFVSTNCQLCLVPLSLCFSFPGCLVGLVLCWIEEKACLLIPPLSSQLSSHRTRKKFWICGWEQRLRSTCHHHDPDENYWHCPCCCRCNISLESQKGSWALPCGAETHSQ